MHYEPSRKRPEVSPLTINLLRLAGWRFSFSRAAWVHRLAKGRYGPVFVVRDDGPPPRPHPARAGFEAVSAAEDAVARAEAAVSAAAASAAAREGEAIDDGLSLPRRRPRGEPPEPGAGQGRPDPSRPATSEAGGPSPHRPDREPASDEGPRPRTGESSGASIDDDERARWKVDGRPVQPAPRPAGGPSHIAPKAPTNKRASA